MNVICAMNIEACLSMVDILYIYTGATMELFLPYVMEDILIEVGQRLSRGYGPGGKDMVILQH